MLIACSTAGFPLETTVTALRRISWAGFAAVELDLSEGDLPDADALRGRLHGENLEVAAVYGGALPEGEFAAQLDAWARLGRLATLARALDAGVLVVAPPQSGELREIAKSLERLDHVLGGLAMDFAVVNRAGTILATPVQFTELWGLDLEARFRIAFDPAEAELAGWDPLTFATLPQPPVHAYWNDVDQGRIVPGGEGNLPLFSLAEKLAAAESAPRSLTVSLANADGWRVEPLARSLAEQVGDLFTN